ncbi:uncharacterized protein LOC131424471 [Marmota monax]|uniref:uncharacterized protein LOC131424471 n=1 Tax=Marmota monax TaxID=9995 RepID=UPI0026E9CB0B|nr:uncharacterized protein LOC131424471 [Marmota monax]
MREVSFSQNQACWQEHIQKETAARVAWNIHYGHKFLKKGTRAKKQPKQAPFRSAPFFGWGGAGGRMVNPGHPGLCCVPGDAMKNFTTSPYARTQTIAKTFYLKSSIFHLPRRTDQLM